MLHVIQLWEFTVVLYLTSLQCKGRCIQNNKQIQGLQNKTVGTLYEELCDRITLCLLFDKYIFQVHILYYRLWGCHRWLSLKFIRDAWISQKRKLSWDLKFSLLNSWFVKYCLKNTSIFLRFMHETEWAPPPAPMIHFISWSISKNEIIKYHIMLSTFRCICLSNFRITKWPGDKSFFFNLIFMSCKI